MIRRTALLCCLATLAACATSSPRRPVDPNAPLRARLTSSPAPDLPTAADAWAGVDRPLRIKDELAGRVLLLAFWTPSSISCTRTLGTLTALQDRFANRPFSVVGVVTGKFDAERDAAIAQAALERAGVAFPLVMDADYALWSQYGAKGWPTLALIDAEGYVVAMEGGEPDARVLEFAIANLLKDGERRGVLAKGPPSWQPAPRSPTSGPLSHPAKVTALPAGRFAVSDTGHHRVLVFTEAGQLVHAIGSGRRGLVDGAFAEAAFDGPAGLAAQGDALYVADAGNHVVRKVELASGRVTTIAGTGELGRGQRELKGPGLATPLRSPLDVAVSGDWLFIAMAGSNQVWRAALSSGHIEPWLGTGEEDFTDGAASTSRLARPSGVAVSGASLVIADSGASAVRQAHLAAGDVSTLAGQGLFLFGDADGAKADARLQFPLGVAAAGDAVYVADTYNGKVRRLKGGQITTVSAGLTRPQGLAVIGSRLLVADTDAHRLVWVDLSTGALEPLTLGPVPDAATGVVRPAFTLKTATVRRGASTVRLVVPAPRNERFSADAPQRATATATGARVTGDVGITVEEDEVRIDVPVEASGPGALSVEVTLYAGPKDKPHTRPGRATLQVPLGLGEDAGELVTVPARLP
jgi:hypothetical protein